MVIHTRLLAGRVSALLAATLLAGCVTQPEPLYRWGEYENLIYTMYMQPGAAEPGLQVQKLRADIERSEAEGKRVPPGVHAQLGYMQYMQGNEADAVEEFAVERRLYPESSDFMTTFIERIDNGS
ncbi:Putative lipoprotein [Salinisphaera shabanensis E1L3A]|uniref:Lipoprotein n=1 Tax=Salinisphaera shabanensis E1L3A TaxID=1033802 RepID=U2EJG2_9GAMM|nr:DUF4810 domain-containing protein [Salinisphaera shabanensis]ERJ18447.1 Putative lipoprotein [Salinisphaera shabanensis E1L3A]